MKAITRDTPEELHISVTPRLAVISAAGALCSATWLLGEVMLRSPEFGERAQGLVGATLTLLLCFLVFWEKASYRFDFLWGQLNWRHRSLWKSRQGQVALDRIRAVHLESSRDSEGDNCSQRIVLMTDEGEIPLTRAYDTSRSNELIVDRIRERLVHPPKICREDMISRLARSGRMIEAVKLTRAQTGLSLREAKERVDTLRKTASA